jgi:hypothetical protein
MCTSCGYKCLPFALAFISLIEMLLGSVRVFIFFGPKPPGNITFFEFFQVHPQHWVQSPFLHSKQGTVAFIIDWAASIVPTLMGIYVVIFLLIILCILIGTWTCIWSICACLASVANKGEKCCCV